MLSSGELALAHEVERDDCGSAWQEREILRQEQKRTHKAECAKLLALEEHRAGPAPDAGASVGQDGGEWGQDQVLGGKRPEVEPLPARQ